MLFFQVSELLGSWGDNELSPECLDGAQVRGCHTVALFIMTVLICFHKNIRCVSGQME